MLAIESNHHHESQVDVDYLAVKSGAWSDELIWQRGELPKSGASVLIPSGVIVEVRSQVQAQFETVNVQGTLRFDGEFSSRLVMRTLMIARDAGLFIGSPDKPVKNRL